MPSLSQVHIQRALDSLALQYANDPRTFAIFQACRVVPVRKVADKYFVYGRDFGAARSPLGTDARILGSLRKPGAEATEVEHSLATEAFSANTYALRQFVSDQELAQADQPLRPLLDAAATTINRLRIDAEQVFARLALETDNYPSTHKVTLTTGASGTSWKSGNLASPSVNSRPLDNLRDGRKVVEQYLQAGANTLILSAEAAQHLADHPDVRDILKYTDPNYLSGEGLPKRLRDLDIYTASAIYNTAAEGAATSLSYVFVDPDNALAAAIVCRAPRSSDLGPSSFFCFQVVPASTDPDMATAAETDRKRSSSLNPGLHSRTYRDDKRAGWIVESEITFDVRFGSEDSNNDQTGAYLILSANV